VESCQLAWDGRKVTCAVQVAALRAGEQIRWEWRVNGGDSFEQTFHATSDVPGMLRVQPYPYPVLAGDIVASAVSFLAGRGTGFQEACAQEMTVPSR